MSGAAEDIPQDGTEVRVRIGARWFTAAYAEDVETGARFLGVKLNGCDWMRVAHGCIAEVRARKFKAPGGRPPEQEPARAPCGARALASPRARQDHAHISVEDVAYRICAMVRTIRTMADGEARFLTAGKRVGWPATVYTAEDMRAQAENHDNRDSALRPPRTRPTPRDLAQLDETWGWFAALDPLTAPERAAHMKNGRLPLSRPQLLVWHIAGGLSAHALARHHHAFKGESDDRLRTEYARHIDRLAAIASARIEQRIAGRIAQAG